MLTCLTFNSKLCANKGVRISEKHMYLICMRARVWRHFQLDLIISQFNVNIRCEYLTSPASNTFDQPIVLRKTMT